MWQRALSVGGGSTINPTVFQTAQIAGGSSVSYPYDTTKTYIIATHLLYGDSTMRQNVWSVQNGVATELVQGGSNASVSCAGTTMTITNLNNSFGTDCVVVQID